MTQRRPLPAALIACMLLIGLACAAARAADAPKPPGKLAIVKAVYGDLPNGPSADVTEKVAAMVKDNALSVEATNDNFGDSAPCVVKKLRVDYTVDGTPRTASVEENQTLKISGAAPASGTLLIVKAVYGDLPDGQAADVTEKIAGMVKDNALSVDATNDNFGDPANGVAKKLRVDYTIGGVPGSLSVNENETLRVSGDAAPLAGALTIVKALYGDLPNGQSADVTQKVAAMLKENGLTVEATNDNFGDPAEGVVKKLQVDYTINGKPQTLTVSEGETLTIPAPPKPAAGT